MCNLLKVNNKDTRANSNLEQFSHIVFFIVGFDYVNAGWEQLGTELLIFGLHQTGGMTSENGVEKSKVLGSFASRHITVAYSF